MKPFSGIAAAVLLSGFVSLTAAEPQKIHIDFAAQPEWTVRTLPDGKKHFTIERAIPIPAVRDRDFSFEAELKLLKIAHYGSISIGLGSSQNPERNVLMRFSKTDRRNRVFFYSGVGMKKKPDTAPSFTGIRTEPYFVRIDYRAADTSLRWRIRSLDGKPVHDTGWVRSHTPLQPDRIIIRATDKNGLGGSQISYDPAGKRIFIRSLVGYEGEIAIGYMIDMEIRDLCLVF